MFLLSHVSKSLATTENPETLSREVLIQLIFQFLGEKKYQYRNTIKTLCDESGIQCISMKLT